MKLVGKVLVEPLEEERLTNIERNLVVHVSEMSQRPVRAPSRMFAFAAIALAVLVAGFIGWKLHGGTPSVAPAAPEQLALRQGKLDLGDAEVASSPNADATIERSANRIVVVMKVGKLDLHVEHKPDRLFVVRAGDVEIEDVGTRFSVDYDGKNNVDVRVTEGVVNVKRNGITVAIKANEAWTVELGPTTIATLEKRAAAVAIQQRNAAVPASPPEDNVVAIAPPTAGNAGSGSGSARKPAAQPVSNARRAILKRPLQRPDIDIGIAKPTVKDYIEYANKPDRGLEEKAWALYGSALLQHHAKNDKDALYTLSGLLRPDRKMNAYRPALWLQVRIRCLQAMDDKCRGAAGLYLQKFASGPEAGIAQLIVSEIP